MILKLLKLLVSLAILAGILFVAYAYLGPIFFPADFAAPVGPDSVPITLEVE